MPRVTPQQGSDKYRQGVQGGATRYTTGVNNVTEAPSAKAIAQQAKMITNWNAAINSGKWAERLGNVSLSAWKQITSSKGAQNYSASADKGATKYNQWAQTAYPIIEQIQNEVESMPSTSLADNIQRMIHNVTRMSELLG